MTERGGTAPRAPDRGGGSEQAQLLALLQGRAAQARAAAEAERALAGEIARRTSRYASAVTAAPPMQAVTLLPPPHRPHARPSSAGRTGPSR